MRRRGQEVEGVAYPADQTPGANEREGGWEKVQWMEREDAG